MTISFISPRRFGKSTFAIKRWLRDPENTCLLTFNKSAVKFLKEKAFELTNNGDKLKEFIENNIMDYEYYAIHLIKNIRKRLKRIVIDDIELFLNYVFGDKVIDTITGTMQRVPIKKPEWFDKHYEEMENQLSEESFKTEYLAKFSE